MRFPKRTTVMAGLAVGILAGSTACYYAANLRQTGPGREIRELTGARTRIVWCRQVTGVGKSVFSAESQLQLTGLDTDDRVGERPVIRKTGHYDKPLISPKGDRVVFSDMAAGKICVVNWDGSALSELAVGRAAALWIDPADGTEWVYAFPQEAINEDGTGKSLIRFKLDNPAIKETIWTATPLTADGIRLSADGNTMGGLFPWPLAGVANLKTGKLQPKGRGCWTSLAPGNTPLFWILDGAHRNVMIHSLDTAEHWKVSINSAPGINGAQIFHPRWSNHARFMCMNGPYCAGDAEQNRIGAGGEAVEVHIGRFDETFHAIEKWVQVTRDKMPDFFPDVWIAPMGANAAIYD